ncbi:MAG: tetratricopeptide repeat protein [Planctomycetota bacterium]
MNPPEIVAELIPRALQATEQGNTGDAVSLYRRIVELEPENDIARNNLGCLLLEAERIDEAVAVLEGAPEDAPPRDLRQNLAYALFSQGEPERAERIFRGILEEAPENGDARNHLGMILLRTNRAQEAVEEFLRVTREHPENVEAWNNLGCAWLGLGDLPRARRNFEEALRVDPYSVDAHNNLGCVLRREGRLDEAIDELTVAVHLEPANPSIHLNLALGYRSSGQPRRALSHLRRHLRLGARGSETNEIRSMLRELEEHGKEGMT